MTINWKEMYLILGLQITADMYFCYICLFYDVMGQGFEYNNTENNAVIVEICFFTNFLNMKWQNETKTSGDKTGLLIYTAPTFSFPFVILVCFTAKTIIYEENPHNNFKF